MDSQERLIGALADDMKQLLGMIFASTDLGMLQDKIRDRTWRVDVEDFPRLPSED